MPTYKNNTNLPITVQDIRFEARETIATETILARLPDGITKLSDLPLFNPTLISASYSGDTDDTEEIEIPVDVVSVRGTIYCDLGSCEIYI